MEILHFVTLQNMLEAVTHASASHVQTYANRHSVQKEIKSNIPFIIGITGLKNSLKSTGVLLFMEFLGGWKLPESRTLPLPHTLAYDGEWGEGLDDSLELTSLISFS